jgi:hypothetical protein
MAMTNFETSLRKQAARAGCDVSQLQTLPVCLDNTWGHLCGFAFFGPAELVERAAQFGLRWHRKETGSGNYNAQYSVMDRGVRDVWITVDEARALGFSPENQYGQHKVTARCISTVYYPDAD